MNFMNYLIKYVKFYLWIIVLATGDPTVPLVTRENINVNIQPFVKIWCENYLTYSKSSLLAYVEIYLSMIFFMYIAKEFFNWEEKYWTTFINMFWYTAFITSRWCHIHTYCRAICDQGQIQSQWSRSLRTQEMNSQQTKEKFKTHNVLVIY